MKVSVAYIKGPRGLGGELAVVPYKANTRSIRRGLEVTLQKGEKERSLKIEDVKNLKGRLAIKLGGIDSEEDAMAWRGGDVLMEMDELAGLEANEYYHFQIEGAAVFEENGDYVGVVTAIDFSSANDVLTIKTADGESLIPFIKSVIVSVDSKTKKIVVRRIEGLF